MQDPDFVLAGAEVALSHCSRKALFQTEQLISVGAEDSWVFQWRWLSWDAYYSMTKAYARNRREACEPTWELGLKGGNVGRYLLTVYLPVLDVDLIEVICVQVGRCWRTHSIMQE